MKLRHFKGERRSEKGSMFVLIAIGLLALAFAVGLALDGGRMFVIGGQLQRATDAAALASVKWVRDRAAEEVREIALQTFRDNLRFNNLTTVEPIISVDHAPEPTQVLVKATTFAAPMFIKLPPLPDVFTINASSRAEYNRRILLLLLDVSGSMWCSADGDCSCLDLAVDPGRCRNGGTRPLRIDLLKESVRTLIELLDASRDRLSIISFSGNPDIMLPFRRDTGFDRDAALAAISVIPPGGGTGTGYALRIAREHLATLSMDIKGERKILLISDGAPIGEKPENHNTPRCQNISFSADEPYRINRVQASSDFLYTIWEGDEVRRAGIQLDMIGFERRELVERDPSHPNYLYQFIWGGDAEHSYWLYANPFLGSRLANSDDFHNRLSVDPNFPQYHGVHDDLTPCDEILKADDAELFALPRGQYLGTNDGAELRSYVLDLGLSSRARLVE